MLVAARAVLLPLDALRMRALVLRGEVVAVLTLAAGENDLVAGHRSGPRRREVEKTGRREPAATNPGSARPSSLA